MDPSREASGSEDLAAEEVGNHLEDHVGKVAQDEDPLQSTNWLRERPGGFPMTLIQLRGDGFGNCDCLDVGCWTGHECPVEESVHEHYWAASHSCCGLRRIMPYHRTLE
jgi:hypothetical protein